MQSMVLEIWSTLWHHEIISNLTKKPICLGVFLFQKWFLWQAIVSSRNRWGIKIKAAKNSAKIVQNFFSYGKQSLEALCFYSGAFFWIGRKKTSKRNYCLATSRHHPSISSSFPANGSAGHPVFRNCNQVFIRRIEVMFFDSFFYNFPRCTTWKQSP